MKKNRLPLRVYLMYLVVATFVISGVAFSKYVVSASDGASARTAKIGEIDLYETKVVDGETVQTTNNEYMIIPGVDIEKDPKVYYTAGEVACAVKVQFILPSYWTNDSTNRSKFSIKSEDTSADLVTFYVNTDDFSFDSAVNGVYTFVKNLAPGEAIGSKSSPVSVIVDDKVSVSSSINKSEMLYLKELLDAAGASNLEVEIQAIVVQID